MNKIDFNCNEESSKLPGALSTFAYFGVLRPIYYNGISQRENMADISNVSNLTTREFQPDYNNDIFIGKNGAVAAAYDFKDLNDEEKEREMAKIMMEKRSEFLDYEFEFVEGKFPVDVIPDNYCDKPIMSTHVLLIKDYEKHIINSKTKSL